MRVRQLIAAAAFILLLLAGMWPVLAPFRPATRLPTIGDRQRAERRDLQRFAEGVLARTENGASIIFLVPADQNDGGLINHRLRYLLPGRFVLTSGSAHYTATWHREQRPGQLIWSGCGGALVKP